MNAIRVLWRAGRAWLLLALVLASVALPAAAAQAQTTTIYLVRHAEKDGEGDDAGLLPAGVERARELAHVLKDAGLTAIFTSEKLRTQLTAEPTVEMTGLAPVADSSEAIAKAILANHIGGSVLVVGHTNTVDDIANGLRVNGISELNSEQFDRLFVIHLTGDSVILARLRYGAPTP